MPVKCWIYIMCKTYSSLILSVHSGHRWKRKYLLMCEIVYWIILIIEHTQRHKYSELQPLLPSPVQLPKLEFAVRMKSKKCADNITRVLQGENDIKSFGVDIGVERVVVETTLPSQKVLELIESTGLQAVLQGMGSTKANHLGAGVAMMSGGGVMGVTRMVQVADDSLVLEGTIDGLNPGKYALFIHELGDLSQGCDSCGDVFDFPNTRTESEKLYGDVGSVTANADGRATFRMENQKVKIWDVIGRSLVLHSLSPKATDDRLACGIIARSSGLFENTKRICACDGVTIWDERNRPLTGPGRRTDPPPGAQL